MLTIGIERRGVNPPALRRDGAAQPLRKKGWGRVDRFRGILLLAAGSLALYRGWRVHSGRQALWAYGLGVLAIALGIWRLTRKEDRRV